MAERGQRGLGVAVVAAAALMLPASASAGLSPWLVGASYNGPTTPERAAERPSVVIRYTGRLPQRSACHGTVAVTLTRGADLLRRRTVRVRTGCRVRVAFSVHRDEIGGATHLRVLQRYRGRTATARVSVPSPSDEVLGSRGLDQGLQAPQALEIS
jgi:hypothetical protein